MALLASSKQSPRATTLRGRCVSLCYPQGWACLALMSRYMNSSLPMAASCKRCINDDDHVILMILLSPRAPTNQAHKVHARQTHKVHARQTHTQTHTHTQTNTHAREISFGSHGINLCCRPLCVFVFVCLFVLVSMCCAVAGKCNRWPPCQDMPRVS